MKTPQDVGKYRLGIIRRLLAGDLTPEQAEKLQHIPDREIARLLHKERFRG